ncbi:hypothetical protein GHT06_020211 [Daphnia sinensis]|uniref:Uncharacterized protein n=1 Tax=Daphnia sinensis TaxID=1820382 RepID=A0AAD5KL54_9CRUS|nr:hypothetical protein GHT06_020211 [Daphnia sinensis]
MLVLNFIHHLIVLNVKTEIGCLDSYSAFPFDNKLQSIKNVLRTSANPLAQVVRRIKEIEDIAIDGFAAPMSTDIICSGLHTNGPTHPNFKGYEYNFMKLQNWKIGTKRPNHCIFLKNGNVALVKNILKTLNGQISILVQKYVKCEHLYLSPRSSKDFQELVVSELSEECELTSVDGLLAKRFDFR